MEVVVVEVVDPKVIVEVVTVVVNVLVNVVKVEVTVVAEAHSTPVAPPQVNVPTSVNVDMVNWGVKEIPLRIPYTQPVPPLTHAADSLQSAKRSATPFSWESTFGTLTRVPPNGEHTVLA